VPQLRAEQTDYNTASDSDVNQRTTDNYIDNTAKHSDSFTSFTALFVSSNAHIASIKITQWNGNMYRLSQPTNQNISGY